MTKTKDPAQSIGSQPITASFADNTVAGPASIVELARALDVDNNGPQLMYEWVHNNIEWEPGWGASKGALGCLMDGAGNAFDQSLLLAALLRQAGYTANIVQGTIRLVEADYQDWWGVVDIWSARAYTFNQFIPLVTWPTWDGVSTFYMDIKHVWVAWVNGGTTYYFDPSRKSYTRKTGLSSGSLASALGYNATTFLNNATSGATIDVNGDYVQNMNRANIRSDLQTMSANLVSYIQSNTIGSAPAGTATVEDVIGGQEIVPATIPLLQTSLPYEAPGDTPTVWTGDVPNSLKTTLQIQMVNESNPAVNDFDYTIYTDQLGGARFTLWYNGSHVPSLYLNGSAVATGVAQTVGVGHQLKFTVVHGAYDSSNWPDSGQGSIAASRKTSPWSQFAIYPEGYYAIGNAWGNLGRGQMTYHQRQWAANLAAGGASTAENVLGEQLAVAWYSWASQNSRATDLINRIKRCHTIYHHQVGIVSFNIFNDNAIATDIGGVKYETHNLDNDSTQQVINDHVAQMHGVALEAAVCAQMSGLSPGISTPTVIDQANRTYRATLGGTVTAGDVITLTVIDAGLGGGSKSKNYTVIGGDTLTTIATALKNAINADTDIAGIGVTAKSYTTQVVLSTLSVNTTTYSKSTSGGATETVTLTSDKIYKGTTSNWNTGTNVQNILVTNGYNSTDMTNLYNDYINNPFIQATAVIPDYPNQKLGSWTGWGDYALPSGGGAYGFINGGYLGGGGQAGTLYIGYADDKKDPEQRKTGGLSEGDSGQPTSSEPIGLFTGDYFYSRTDITVGSSRFPYCLGFGRFYNSASQFLDGPLGRGWKHNFDITARVGYSGLSAMGSDYAIPACATIVELFINADIISDTTRPIKKLATMAIADAWWIDQLIKNTVIVQFPHGAQIFIKQPDGSYSPLLANANTLTLVSGLYSFKTTQGLQLNFNSAGQIATMVHPAGVTVTLTYSSGKLQSVTNGLNRTLTLSYSGNYISSVSDGNGRSVSYIIDGNKNLTTFTDALSKSTSYTYDLPGRLTQIFKPANPLDAIVTNTYDSLGRVQNQKDAFNHQWDYFFAGSRTEERDPGGNAKVYYFKTSGKVLKFINQVGQIWTNSYDGLDRIVSSVAPEGNSSSFTYDNKNNLLSITSVPKSGSGLSNITVNFTYDSTWNRVHTVQDGLGNTTTLNYNASTGTLKDVQGPTVGGLTPKGMFFYNTRGQLLSAVDPTGIQSQFVYDGTLEKMTSAKANTNWTATISGTVTVGNVLTLTANDAGLPGGQKSVSYTVIGGDTLTSIATGLKNAVNADSTLAGLNIVAYSNGAVVSITTAADNTTTYSSSTSMGATETITLAAGLVLTASFGYDSIGNTTSITDPRSNQTTFSFDNERRMTQRTECSPFSFLMQFGYDDNNNLTSLQRQTAGVPMWQTTTIAYTLSDKRKTVTDPANRVTKWEYDSLDRLQKITDAELRTVTYAYDNASRLYTITDNSGNVAQTYTYTNNGKLYQLSDARSNTTTYSYDGFDRQDRTTYPDTTYEQNSSYDANGNVLTYRCRSGNTITNTFDVLNRLSTKSPMSQPVVTMTYDLAGRVTKVSTPVVVNHPESGDFQYFFDSAGRLIKEQAPDAKNVQYQLDNNGNVTKLTYPDGYFVTRVYDNLNRLTDIKLNGAGGSAVVFGYDQLSRRTSLTWDNGVTTSYTYHLNNDLTALTHVFVGSTMSYALGFNGSHQLSSQGSVESSFWHPSGGGTTTYGTATNVNEYPTVGGVSQSYNANGCLTGDGTWTFGFDTENHLTSASKTGVSASFLYDAMHRQTLKTVGSTLIRYFYAGIKRLADYDGTSGTLQNRYVYGDGLDEALIIVPNSGANTYLHADYIGSIVATSGTTSPNIGKVTNTNKYSAWGDATAVSGSTFGFTGQRYDSDLDLYYCKMRYYSPKLGRFLQPDPIGYGGGANIYGYTGNDPLNATDSMGLASSGGGGGGGGGSSGGSGHGVLLSTGYFDTPDDGFDVGDWTGLYSGGQKVYLAVQQTYKVSYVLFPAAEGLEIPAAGTPYHAGLFIERSDGFCTRIDYKPGGGVDSAVVSYVESWNKESLLHDKTPTAFLMSDTRLAPSSPQMPYNQFVGNLLRLAKTDFDNGTIFPNYSLSPGIDPKGVVESIMSIGDTTSNQLLGNLIRNAGGATDSNFVGLRWTKSGPAQYFVPYLNGLGVLGTAI